MKRKGMIFVMAVLLFAFPAGCGREGQITEAGSAQEVQEEEVLLSGDSETEEILLSGDRETEETSLSGEEDDPGLDGDISEEEENAMAADTQIEQNREFLMEQVGTPENGTMGTAQLLAEVGCGIIREIDSAEDNGKSYIIVVTDDAGQQFLFTMGYDGYPGYIKDGEGNFLYMPVD
ncbi:MAG: hypothetical protein LIO96_03915 [Lachnospiraceae bacterium]|nr:hypothetical protein [Lachnospiraceae bacterium]